MFLHLRLGEALEVPDEWGRPRRLRLVALLKGSIFQGELVMGRADFLRLFPGENGYRLVLVRADPAAGVDVHRLKRTLERDLVDFGVVVDRTAERLALFSAVAGTYLSTFRVVGGFGLVLGTLGLAVVLVRGLLERKAELALFLAVGFRRGAVLRAVLAENAFLLVSGLAAGTVSAMLAVVPELAGGAGEADWGALAITLLAVVGIGLVALTAAVTLGLRFISVEDLRAE